MDQGSLVLFVEVIFRIVLGLRFLSSGISNVRRWPQAAQTAAIVFPRGSYFFGFVATALMVLGGVGLAIGFQTPVAAAMLIVFLIPTFKIHYHWLQTEPAKVRAVGEAIANEEARSAFRVIGRHATHSHETGWQNNLVLLSGCLYFSVRGCIAFGLDNLVKSWVIWLF